MNKVNRIFMSLLGKRKKSRLPSGYTELEYISNPSTAYINTDVRYSSTDEVVVHIDKLSFVGTSYIGIFGTARAVGNTWHRSSLAYDGNGVGTYQVLFGQYQMNLASGHMPTSDVAIDAMFSDGSQSVSITDSGTTRSYTTSFTELQSVSLPPMMLFNYNRNGVPSSYYLVGSVGEFSVKINSVDSIDYVPAQRDSDGIVGMYDLISNTFKVSSDTVQFVAGPIKQL